MRSFEQIVDSYLAEYCAHYRPVLGDLAAELADDVRSAIYAWRATGLQSDVLQEELRLMAQRIPFEQRQARLLERAQERMDARRAAQPARVLQ
jgi:hypothetical protein